MTDFWTTVFSLFLWLIDYQSSFVQQLILVQHQYIVGLFSVLNNALELLNGTFAFV